MTEPVYRQLGAKIEAIRTTLGWTQGDLATKVGLTRCSITNIEAGRQRVQLHVVEKIAGAFGTTTKQLMKGIWF
jgi:transcriptional regulator with XRE-family HTH domain